MSKYQADVKQNFKSVKKVQVAIFSEKTKLQYTQGSTARPRLQQNHRREGKEPRKFNLNEKHIQQRGNGYGKKMVTEWLTQKLSTGLIRFSQKQFKNALSI